MRRTFLLIGEMPTHTITAICEWCEEAHVFDATLAEDGMVVVKYRVCYRTELMMRGLH